MTEGEKKSTKKLKPRRAEKQKAVFDRVYRTLKKAGYDDISISGILGNARTESGYDPDSIGPSHYGLFQNSGNIRKAIVDRYGDYSLDSQVKYIMDWNDSADWIRKGKYSAHTATNHGRFRKTGYKTPEEASDAFMKLYERPVIMKDGKVVGYQAHDQRRKHSIDALNQIRRAYGTTADKKTVVPYRDDDYNYYRANQLGYKPDQNGHMPSRDEVTGMYLKKPSHQTVIKALASDLMEGYNPYYNPRDGQIYSDTFIQPLNVPQPINTDYSLMNTPIQNPRSGAMNAWYGAESPSYGGYDFRIPDISNFLDTISVLPVMH